MPAPGARKPVLEACTDKNYRLGKIGQRVRRPVKRVIMTDDMMDVATITNLNAFVHSNPGSSLHGSLPCTPWSSWQQLNDQKEFDQLRARIFRMRAESMIMLSNFCRVARVVLQYGGAVSFELPSHCCGWKEQAVINIIEKLGMEPVKIHGCQ
eukprot:7831431-Heterocapsa_arctica.AAC.1